MIEDFKEDATIEEMEDFIKDRWKSDFWAVIEIGDKKNLPCNEQIPVMLVKYCCILEVDRLVKEGALKSEDKVLEAASARFPEKDWKKHIEEMDKQMKWKAEHFDYSDNPVHYGCREEK